MKISGEKYSPARNAGSLLILRGHQAAWRPGGLGAAPGDGGREAGTEASRRGLFSVAGSKRFPLPDPTTWGASRDGQRHPDMPGAVTPKPPRAAFWSNKNVLFEVFSLSAILPHTSSDPVQCFFLLSVSFARVLSGGL